MNKSSNLSRDFLPIIIVSAVCIVLSLILKDVAPVSIAALLIWSATKGR